jgi:galactokinase
VRVRSSCVDASGAGQVAVNEAAARIAAALEGAGRRWFHAPGRVNLIGEHTDYNDGFVLPIAIDRSCVVAAAPSPRVRVVSLDADGVLEIPPDGSLEPASAEPAWGRYVAGVVRELATRGRPSSGVDAVLASDVPLGAGLSSSAALEVAVAIALAATAEWELGDVELAEACRSAEESATGVQVGIMDQLISLAAVAGTALLIDCRSLEMRPVPFPEGMAVLVVHSGISRSLREAGYADRRRASEDLARKLGLASLRDATETQVTDDPIGRHVVSENRRVLEAVEALEEGNLDRLGRLLDASHASMRDDFRISTPELDRLVDQLRRAGAYGARLTGGGFGGCALAVCDAASTEDVADEATRRYRADTGREPKAFVCEAVSGAREMNFLQ